MPYRRKLSLQCSLFVVFVPHPFSKRNCKTARNDNNNNSPEHTVREHQFKVLWINLPCRWSAVHTFAPPRVSWKKKRSATCISYVICFFEVTAVETLVEMPKKNDFTLHLWNRFEMDKSSQWIPNASALQSISRPLAGCVRCLLRWRMPLFVTVDNPIREKRQRENKIECEEEDEKNVYYIPWNLCQNCHQPKGISVELVDSIRRAAQKKWCVKYTYTPPIKKTLLTITIMKIFTVSHR